MNPLQRLQIPVCLVLAALGSARDANAQCVSNELINPDGSTGSGFGWLSKTSGGTILLSSPYDDWAGPDTGGVYRYSVSTTGLVYEERWPGVDLGGRSMAIDGTWAAYQLDDTRIQTYRRTAPNTWVPGPIVQAPEEFLWDGIDIQDGVVPRLAVVEDQHGPGNPGCVRVFAYFSGDWFLEDTMDPTTGYTLASVAISGDHILVGTNPASGAGSVSVFQRSGPQWLENQILQSPNSQTGGQFGHTLAVQGDTLLVPARYEDLHLGNAYMFVRTNGWWVYQQTLSAPGTHNFGWNVALDGNRALIASESTGEALFFERSGSTWSETARINPGGASRVTSVAIAGPAFLVKDTHGFLSEVTFVGPFGGPDCNGNGRADMCDIFDGIASDLNGNQVPDGCECGDQVRYCSSTVHSGGTNAQIAGSGPTSVSLNNFTLRVADASPNKPGLFFYGGGQIAVPFGDGLRCVSAGGMGVHRLAPVVVTDAQGEVNRTLDFTAPPANGGIGQISPLSTWNFQFYFRDPMGPGGSGFNLTDAVSVTFCP